MGSYNVVTHPGDIAALKTIFKKSRQDRHEKVDLDFKASEGVSVRDVSFITTREGRIIKLDLSDFYLIGTQAYQALAALDSLMSLRLPIVTDNIPDLEFLAGMKYLQLLDLTEDTHSECWPSLDLAPLRVLTSLRKLRLDGLKVKDGDLSPLSGLTELIVLQLAKSGNVFDLTPLAGLNKLCSLDLGGNKVVKDLSPLAGLRKLNNVDLINSDIEDLSPLAGIVTLGVLNLEGNQISDIRPLAGCNLWELNLGFNKISDIGPLADVGSLKHLILRNNDIRDLSPLSGLLELEHLDIRLNPIEDYQPLIDMRDRPYFSLYTSFSVYASRKPFPPEVKELLEEAGCRVDLYRDADDCDSDDEDCRPEFIKDDFDLTDDYPDQLTVTGDDCPDGILEVADNPDLCEIEAQSAGLERVVLKNLPSLIDLNFTGNRISDLETILKDLDTDYYAGRGMKLEFSHNQISDMGPLRGVNNVHYLALANNKIERIEALPYFFSEDGDTRDAVMDLDNNLISDLSPLLKEEYAESLRNLSRLYLQGNPIKDYTPLVEVSWAYGMEIVVNDDFPPELKERLDDQGVRVFLSGQEDNDDDCDSDDEDGGDRHTYEILDVKCGDCPDGFLKVADNSKLTDIFSGHEANLEKVVLSNLPRLRRIMLSCNRISNLEDMLKDLGADGNSKMEVDLSSNQISDIRPLRRLQNVRYLNLGNNKIENLDALPGFSVRVGDDAPELLLGDNLISDLTPLLKEEYAESLSNLSRLYLDGNPIKDYTPLLEIAWGSPMGILVNRDFPPELKERLEDKGVRVCFDEDDFDDEDEDYDDDDDCDDDDDGNGAEDTEDDE